MAMPSCGKCGGHSFEMVTHSPRGARFKQNLIQCSGCGMPAGVVGYWDAGQKLIEQEKALDSISVRLGRMEALLANLTQAVAQMLRKAG